MEKNLTPTATMNSSIFSKIKEKNSECFILAKLKEMKNYPIRRSIDNSHYPNHVDIKIHKQGNK